MIPSAELGHKSVLRFSSEGKIRIVLACQSAACTLLGASLIVAGSACSRPVSDSEVTAVVATVAVEPTNVSLPVGQTLQLSAMVGDAAGNMVPRRGASPTLTVGPTQKPSSVIGDAKGRTGRIVTWSSSQPSRVRVGIDGLVTALAAGEATITATCEGQRGTATVIVTEPSLSSATVSPASVVLPVGAAVQLSATLQDAQGRALTSPITWRSEEPSRATVSPTGLVTTLQAGATTIIATNGSWSGTATVTITPVTTVSGLDFPGNAGANTTMRFEFTSPPSAYPATYIWLAYPRQQRSYYTALFWGNNGAFFPSHTYYGFHPYPDWDTSHRHFWEIAAPPGGDFVSASHVVYDRWYLQVAVCEESEGGTLHTFYWDWPDTTKVVRNAGARVSDPPTPGLVVGDAPWNQGHEVWDGVLRGFQFYDVALTPTEIAQEIRVPGSVRTPWYLNLNPTPGDISDKSGNGHIPEWVGGERPSWWTGKLNPAGVVRTSIPPR